MEDAASIPTLADLLASHLADSGLPPDGGDSEPFAVVKLAMLPYPIPNTKSRKHAVKIHDLNHLVTGYGTDRIGELEISAWELASGGCNRYVAAWFLDLAGLGAGLLLAPRRTVRAFMIGRGQQNLYGRQLEDLLGMPADAARRVILRPESDRWRAIPSALHLAALLAAALPVVVVMSAAWYVLVPAWGLSNLRRSLHGRKLTADTLS